MAITFTYTESTNKVVVTEGTSGTPATFADFVTADRAGTDTDLLVAGSPASDLALTYAVRSVEFRAIVVKCIVANKTAEADFIFITGTDAWDVAQTESIDVTAGNGSYTSTKRWRTITTLDCSDNAAGGGTVWADGDLSVTQDIWGVIWDHGNGQYLIDCNFEIGDDSTPTHFASKNEQVVFADNMQPEVRVAATLYMGSIDNSYGVDGSIWSLNSGSNASFVSGTALIYDSYIKGRGDNFIQFDGTSTLVNSTFGYSIAAGYDRYPYFTSTWTLERVYINNIDRGINNTTSPVSISDVQVNECRYGILAEADATISNFKVENATTADVYAYSGDLTIRNPVAALGTVKIGTAGKWIKEQYSCDIHIVDKDGSNLSGVTVDCEDTNTDAVWAAGTITTDANGDITQQWITYRYWINTDEALTTYSPHKFTISKAGYETLVLESITIDAPIVWHLELQDSHPIVGDVLFNLDAEPHVLLAETLVTEV